MKYSKLALSAFIAARKCIAEARKGSSYYYIHRDIEIVTCDSEGRVCDEAFLIRLRDLSGKALKIAFEEVASDSPPFTHFGITGGLDAYDSMSDMMKGYDYSPWVETWDLEDIEKGEIK